MKQSQNLYKIITYPLFLHYNLSKEGLSYFSEDQFEEAKVLTSIALVVFVFYGVKHLNVASEAKDFNLVSFIPLIYTFLLITPYSDFKVWIHNSSLFAAGCFAIATSNVYYLYPFKFLSIKNKI